MPLPHSETRVSIDFGLTPCLAECLDLLFVGTPLLQLIHIHFLGHSDLLVVSDYLLLLVLQIEIRTAYKGQSYDQTYYETCPFKIYSKENNQRKPCNAAADQCISELLLIHRLRCLDPFSVELLSVKIFLISAGRTVVVHVARHSAVSVFTHFPFPFHRHSVFSAGLFIFRSILTHFCHIYTYYMIILLSISNSKISVLPGDVMSDKRTLPLPADLYFTFARVGLMMFGGGYAMLPILQREIVEKKGWATEDQLADYYAVGQCTPGVIAVNTATFVGSSNAGITGGILATLGIISGPLLIILAVAAFLSGFMETPVIAHAFSGIRACVTALILSSVIKLFKNSVTDWPTRIIYLAVLGLAAAGTFLPAPAVFGEAWDVITSPVFLVLMSGILGFAIRRAKGGLKK